MATLTIEIVRKHSPYPVSFLIRQGNTKKRIPTGITLAASEVSPSGKRIKNITKAQLIETKRRELQDKLDEIMINSIGRKVDAEYLVKRLLTSSQSLDFFSFAEDWLKRSTIKGKKNYYTMLNSLERNLGHRSLSFDEITYGLLKEYEEFLSDKPRAQSLYLGMMRHLYREAMRRYNTDYDQVIKNDPFMRYQVPKQVLIKGVRALTLEQLMKIYQYKGGENSRAQLARDCFILSFCLMGMNSVDMFSVDTIKNNTICYCRQKTRDRRSDHAYIEVKIHPFIKDLMQKYKGEGRIFNFAKRYSDAKDFNRALNLGLKEVGTAVGIKGLNFYQARHTFATLSRNLMKFSKGDVDEALNHIGTMELADIYIKKDFSIINENNFKLIECVFKEIER